ncbi:MAG: DUF1559 domain-containing protein [bacterium]|nr:DUF1559 domain-containing protein [bacterium]
MTAILLPALSRARDNARRAVCLSNLRQLGMACLLYEADHGYFPPEGADSQPTAQVYGHSWKRAILPYIGKDPKTTINQRNTPIFYCRQKRGIGSYGINRNLALLDMWDSNVQKPFPTSTAKLYKLGQDTSRIPLISDAYYSYFSCAEHLTRSSLLYPPSSMSSFWGNCHYPYQYFDPPRYVWPVSDVTGMGSLNMFFVDGHGETISWGKKAINIIIIPQGGYSPQISTW